MRRLNVLTVPIEPDAGEPAGYRCGSERFGPRIGAVRLGGTVYELPEGESVCPYHYEYGREEWLVVLAGRPTLRHPAGEDVLEPGDVVVFPEGREGAHKVTNREAAPARVLMLSNADEPSVAVYPDSDKIGVWTGEDSDHVIVRRSSGVGYYDGED